MYVELLAWIQELLPCRQYLSISSLQKSMNYLLLYEAFHLILLAARIDLRRLFTALLEVKTSQSNDFVK